MVAAFYTSSIICYSLIILPFDTVSFEQFNSIYFSFIWSRRGL